MRTNPSTVFCSVGNASLLIITLVAPSAFGSTNQLRYYAHRAVHDQHGVIAPWYRGLNGQCDFRVRIAAETLKRYPWTTGTNAIASYPANVFSGFWQISSNGTITPRHPGDWGNGDLSQRATSLLNGFVDYYRYTGDAAAIAQLTYMADYLVDHCLTPPDHPWPGMFVSVPVKGKAFWKCDPRGMIQLDLCASTGQGLLRAYQLAGNTRWFETAKHWGDLLAAHCNLDPQADPWPRYANPEAVPWKDNKQTGGVTMILAFLDDLIRLGYAGQDNRIVAARDAGRRYLRDRLLPAWAANDTWGRYFWDWANPVQNCLTTPDAARYVLEHSDVFDNWRHDARNILTLFLNHSSVSPKSSGGVYSGAWAFPEASQCCGRSLWYAPFCVAPALAEYAVQANDPWCRELAYRMMVLQTYDAHETGVTEDNIDGGVIVNGDWLNIAHPLPLRWMLAALAWLPEELGANRENHILRSSAVVSLANYGRGRIEYTSLDAPDKAVDVLRLAFVPKEITADSKRLSRRRELEANGYMIKQLPNGDAIVTIRHDGAKRVVVSGDDPQQVLLSKDLAREGEWREQAGGTADGCYAADTAGAAVTARFDGNQVRLVGCVGPAGGIADVYLDGEKQLVHVDTWNPAPRSGQVLYYRNGLDQGSHTLRLVARGAGNAYSRGSSIGIQSVQYSAASGVANFPSATGPRETQRMVFGYTGRKDLRDSRGHTWRPATEFVTRIGEGKDSVAECWWTAPVVEPIAGTPDAELYRYGVHGRDFWVNVTVGLGRYHARLKFAATRGLDTRKNCFDIRINGRRVVERLDVAATAGGPHRAVDLVFNDIAPADGVIEIRFTASRAPESGKAVLGEAFVQALEVGPGDGGKGAKPVSVAALTDPFDYFENSWSVIGLRDYENATRIMPADELLLADKIKARLSFGPNLTPLSRHQTKTLLDGWLPVVLLHTEEDGVRYEFKLWATPLHTVKDWRAAFAWPTEGENFLNWIEVKAINLGNSTKQACLRLDQVTSTNKIVTFGEWNVTLAPAQSAQTCFRIPCAPVAGARTAMSADSTSLADTAVRAPSAEGELWRKRTIDFWRHLLATGARIEVPCEKAAQALKAVHIQQFMNNDHGVLKGGEGFYDEFYIRDGAYQILQFEEAGFTDAARKAVEPYLKSQRPDGRFETQKNQFDANGQALWTLWQYWKITGDREFLKRAYPQMRRAVEWIKQARRTASSDSPFAGLLPNAVADGEYLWDGKHHIVGYDLWNLRGLICAADAAQALGETADAQELRSEADAYRKAIDAACQRSGLPHFPPSWEKAGTHWGNTETLWPTELFATDDPRVTASLREVREKFMGGFVEGTMRWSGFPDVIHPYMSSYTTMASLTRGEHERFVEDFHWYLLHSTATHAFPEGIYYKKRFAWSDTIPHATGAANFAFLLHHALIHERGDELHLLRGVPDWWLEAGREIRAEDAPTHFGLLSLRVKGVAKGVEINFKAPTRQAPKRIILHLPKSRPLTTSLKSVELDYRADDSKRWDFRRVIEAHRSQAEVRVK